MIIGDFLNNIRHSELCDHDVKISLTHSEDDYSAEHCEEMHADVANIEDSREDEHVSEEKHGRLTASCDYCGLRERVV